MPPTDMAARSIHVALQRMTPPYGLRNPGPLIVGAAEGDASGAGIGLPAGACGGGGANRVVGSPPNPRPNPVVVPACPPRANPGVDATTQAVANAAARIRFIFVAPHSALPPIPSFNHAARRDLISIASIERPLRPSDWI